MNVRQDQESGVKSLQIARSFFKFALVSNRPLLQQEWRFIKATLTKGHQVQLRTKVSDSKQGDYTYHLRSKRDKTCHS